MSYGVIYTVENKVNGKIYVGQTTKSFNERYGGDILNTHNEHLRNSIKKYGIGNFAIDKCICECDTKESLDEAEKFYIDFFDAMNPEHGYNKRDGGSNGRLSEETKEKVSQRTKEAMANPEIREKVSQRTKEAMANPEVRKKYKEAMANPEVRKKYKEAMANPEVRKKISQKMKEAMANPEVKEKKSQNMKRLWQNPEYREKTSKSIKEALNRPEVKEKYKETLNRPEVKEKKSQNMKRLWQNPEYREKTSKSIKETLNRPEIRKKISQRIKEAMAGSKHPKARTIVQLDKKGNFIRKWSSIKEAAKELNIIRQNISGCCSGKRKSAGGYKFMYEEDYINLIKCGF